jgi:hypothetical protein
MRVELCQLDRSFAQEIDFLFNTAEPLCERIVREMLLDCMPTDIATCTFADTVIKAQKLKQSHMVHASRSTLAKEVDSVINFVAALAEGQPPACSSFTSMSHFFKSVIARSEYFVTSSRKKLEPGKMFPVTESFSGRVALELIYKDFVDEANTEAAESGKTLQAFRWLLTELQNNEVDGKMKAIIRSKRSSLLTLKAIAGEPAGPAAAASSSTCTALVPKTAKVWSTDTAMTPKEEAKNALDKAARDRLRKILSGE